MKASKDFPHHTLAGDVACLYQEFAQTSECIGYCEQKQKYILPHHLPRKHCFKKNCPHFKTLKIVKELQE